MFMDIPSFSLQCGNTIHSGICLIGHKNEVSLQHSICHTSDIITTHIFYNITAYECLSIFIRLIYAVKSTTKSLACFPRGNLHKRGGTEVMQLTGIALGISGMTNPSPVPNQPMVRR